MTQTQNISKQTKLGYFQGAVMCETYTDTDEYGKGITCVAGILDIQFDEGESEVTETSKALEDELLNEFCS